MLRMHVRGLQLLVINVGTRLWEGKRPPGPPGALAKEMLGMTAIQFRRCAWPVRAPEGCSQQPATFQRIRTNRSPDGLWDRFFGALLQEAFGCHSTPPIISVPGGEKGGLLVRQPSAFRHYITQQPRKESVLETRGFCGLLCVFCWLVS